MIIVQEHDQQFPETVIESPLPGGAADVVRWLFNVPQWIQIGGAILGLIVGITVAIVLWRRRKEIWDWISTRSQQVKVGLATVTVIMVAAIITFSGLAWDYMQHDNGFCTGCHVMATPFRKFERSAHDALNCHDCHRQSIFASTKQLYLWVAERPMEISDHSPVANEICAECHIQEQPDSLRDRIVATAGHRLHLESTDTVLTDLLCVTCHGAEVHEFAPANLTCGQSECHDDQDIRLGAMAGQTSIHCAVCHVFTAELDEEAPLDSAGLLMVARESNCLSCHEMEERVAGLIPGEEPHAGGCGFCHNPHQQAEPADAFATCANAGCHSGIDTLELHQDITGTAEELADCSTCHEAHDWHISVDACVTCHEDILNDATPFRIAAAHPSGTGEMTDSELAETDLGNEAQADEFLTRVARLLAEDVDAGVLDYSESWRLDGGGSVQEGPRPLRHSEHAEVSCSLCHSMGEGHGVLKLTSENDCLECHHAEPAPAVCVDCHSEPSIAGERPQSVELAFSVWDSTTTRQLPFDHARHESVECATCHAEALTYAVTNACAECHDDHHMPALACMDCHRAEREEPHTLNVHSLGCGGTDCHADAMSYTAMERSRSFCETCHSDQIEHEPDKVCAECHKVPDIEAGESPDAGV